MECLLHDNVPNVMNRPLDVVFQTTFQNNPCNINEEWLYYLWFIHYMPY